MPARFWWQTKSQIYSVWDCKYQEITNQNFNFESRAFVQKSKSWSVAWMTIQIWSPQIPTISPSRKENVWESDAWEKWNSLSVNLNVITNLDNKITHVRNEWDIYLH